MSHSIEKNYEYFKKILPELLNQHKGEYVVISEGKEKGFFKSTKEAYDYGVKNFGLGNFILQIVEDEEERVFRGHARSWRVKPTLVS